MATILGIKFNDYVLLTAAGLGAHYYIKITDHEDTMTTLDDHKVLVCAGEDGPRKNFAEYIKCNLALNRVREDGLVPDTISTASFMRNTLASAIRSRGGAYEVNTLLAGYDSPVSKYDDSKAAAHLFYLDYLGTMQEVKYAAHGYGTTFATAILDRYYRPDMTPQEGIDLMQMCIDEVKKRIIISTPHFISRVITKDGVQILEAVH